MASTPQASVREASPKTGALPKKEINHALLAKMHIREGKPFRECAMAAGYSESSAMMGLKKLMAMSLPLTGAIRQEWEALNADVTKLKPLAVARLCREITDPDSNNGMKAIELAGRFRETDWFVRNSEIQLGVFLGMTEQSPTPTEPDQFKE